MPKKSRGELLRSILKQIESGPLTPNEIAENIGSNWDTVKSNLEILEEIGLCKSEIEGKKKTIYRQTDHMLEGDERAWFNIPLNEEDVQKTQTVFASAKEAWKKWVGKEPNDIQLEKTAFELSYNNPEFKIPMGWYLYGPMAQMRIQSMSLTGADDHLVNQAKEIVETQNKYPYSTSLIRDLYKRYDRKTHLNRVEFDELLKRGIRTAEQKSNAIMYLNTIIRNMNNNIEVFQNSMNSANEKFDAFISITSKLIISKESKEINNELVGPIQEAFTLLWKFISRINYFEDLKEFVPVEILKPRLNQGFIDTLQDIEIALTMLDGFLPQTKPTPSPRLAKYVGIAKD